MRGSSIGDRGGGLVGEVQGHAAHRVGARRQRCGFEGKIRADKEEHRCSGALCVIQDRCIVHCQVSVV